MQDTDVQASLATEAFTEEPAMQDTDVQAPLATEAFTEEPVMQDTEREEEAADVRFEEEKTTGVLSGEESRAEAESARIPSEILSGQCGEDVWWELDRRNGILTLSGSGATYDYNLGDDWLGGRDERPGWYSSRGFIRKAVIGEGITRLGIYVLADCYNLTEVDLGTVEELGLGALSNTALVEVKLPETLETMDETCMSDNPYLESVTVPESVARMVIPFFNCPSMKTLVFEGSPHINGYADTEIPDCIFYYSEDTRFGFDDSQVTIYAYAGSTAEEYAKEHGHPFVELAYSDGMSEESTDRAE